MKYRPLLRPASRYTLPAGVRWDYVEEPAIHGLAHRPDLPRSSYPYGVISTDRPLTPDEREQFSLREV